MRNHAIVPSRRISGGGTVYHDSGNLNYTFLTGRDAYASPDLDVAAARSQIDGMPPQLVLDPLGVQHTDVFGYGSLTCYRRLRRL